MGRPRTYPTEAARRAAYQARRKAERDELKAHGQCPKCRALVGHYVYCLDCRRERMAIWRRWYRTHGRAA